MNFNISDKEYSISDRTRNIKLPNKESQELAEFVGVLLGDGYMYNGTTKYIIGIVGDPIRDKEYYFYLQSLIKSLFNLKIAPKKIGRGLRLIFQSKAIFKLLEKYFISYYGKEKSENTRLPSLFDNDWNLLKCTIRGLIDTDGSIFSCHKPGIKNYPSIEITTSSFILANQLKNKLDSHGFRVANIWSYKSKKSKRISYKVPLNGKNNLTLWIRDIGFSNPYTKRKALEIISGTCGI
jgi:hypothetical protein